MPSRNGTSEPADRGAPGSGRAARARGGSAPRLTLDTPVTYLKGVGERRAALLRRLGIVTAGDLLMHIPHRYEDASTVSPISTLDVGMEATVIGTVISKGVLPTRRGLRIFQVVLRDDSGMIEVSWPGQPYLDRVIAKQDVLLVTGPVRFFHGRQLQPREFVNLGSEAEGTDAGRVLAVYGATEGLSVKVLRSLLEAHLDRCCRWSRSRCRRHCWPMPACRRCRTPCGWCTARHRSPRPRRDAIDWPSRSCSSYSSCSGGPIGSLARTERASLTRTSAASPARSRRPCRSSSRGRRCARCARSSPTWAVIRGCIGCCRATSAAARRSSRCSPRSWPWRTAIRWR